MTDPSNQPVANLTLSENEFDVHEATAENPLIGMTEPNNQPVTNLAVSENESDVDGATAENQAVNVISTRTPPGFLDLPSELRLNIYRYLLVTPYCLDFGWGAFRPRPSVNILRTSRLIHGEAFHILYGENQFSNRLVDSSYSLTRFPRVTDTIRRIRVPMLIGTYSSQHEANMTTRSSIRSFVRCMLQFGHPSITRDILTLDMFFMGFQSNPSGLRLMEESVHLKRFIRALRQFINFRTIQVHCDRLGGCAPPDLDGLQTLGAALEPVLGPAEEDGRYRDNNGLRFHPLAHRHRQRNPNNEHGDWANSLDAGIHFD